MNPLDRENSITLQALQASHGLISSGMYAISVQTEEDRIVLHFAIDRESAEIEEDIEDILFELDALLGGSHLITHRIHVGRPDSNWPGRPWRLIYLAKGAADS